MNPLCKTTSLHEYNSPCTWAAVSFREKHMYSTGASQSTLLPVISTVNLLSLKGLTHTAVIYRAATSNTQVSLAHLPKMCLKAGKN